MRQLVISGIDHGLALQFNCQVEKVMCSQWGSGRFSFVEMLAWHYNRMPYWWVFPLCKICLYMLHV